MSEIQESTLCGHCTECKYDCCFSNQNCGDSHIFGLLTPEELHTLMDNKRQIHFRSGETILKQNTPLTHLVCIKSGLAKVVSEDPKGKNLILQIVKSNSIFTGGGSIVDDFRHFTVAAITDVDCCFIDTSRLYNTLTKNSAFAIELLKHSNNQHLKMLSTLINLSNKYMPGRVADTLLYLKNNIFETNPYDFILSKQELADMSGMTKESFIRSLKEFEDSGLIHHSRNTIEILKESELTEISRNG
ncbi:MAG: Crp/Fnr family transcriptional regulator [Prolixibacteraceae bacterium]|nr:Crp/Fnr family transcriptional regulator [Prolixibacteraceae bacterium]